MILKTKIMQIKTAAKSLSLKQDNTQNNILKTIAAELCFNGNICSFWQTKNI